MYEFTPTIKVTLKYTGVDTAGAYVGTETAHHVDISTDYLDKIQNGQVSDAINIGLDVWSKGFKLVPGYGKTAQIAYSSGEELTFYGLEANGEKGTTENVKDCLAFELNASETGGASAYVAINTQTGMLQLLSGYKLSQHYITINIYCEYPAKDANGTITADGNLPKVLIGSVQIVCD